MLDDGSALVVLVVALTSCKSSKLDPGPTVTNTIIAIALTIRYSFMVHNQRFDLKGS